MGLKLLYITNGINGPGGLERVLSIKASHLAEEYGYNVHVLVLNNAHTNPFYEFSPKIKFHSIEVGGNPINYFNSYKKGIQKIVDQIQPHIISVCDDGLKGFFLPNIIKTPAKWIYERHASVLLNTDNGFKGKIQRQLMNWNIPKFKRFVVLTPSNIKEWKGNNIIAIPNPLSFESSNTSSLENKKIIVVGSHSYNKGYDLLLKVWENIEQKHSDWELNIYGKYDKNNTFVKMSNDMGLKNVKFHNPVKNIKDKYLESSIMLLTSRSEGFGMVLIEAMECGLPCVSFDCPSGPADIIKDGDDGFLIQPESINEMTEKLLLLIENKELRKTMGEHAKKNVKRFSPDNIVRLWDELFKSLINR